MRSISNKLRLCRKNASRDATGSDMAWDASRGLLHGDEKGKMHIVLTVKISRHRILPDSGPGVDEILNPKPQQC